MSYHDMTSKTLSVAAALLLFSQIGSAVAQDNCYVDAWGYTRCNSLGYGARAGIGVAIIILICLLVLSLFYARRRRLARWQAEHGTAASQGFSGPHHLQQQPYGPPLHSDPRMYESANPNVNYGPDASGWQPPPPKYEPAPHATERVPSSTPSYSYAPPQGAPPTGHNANAANV